MDGKKQEDELKTFNLSAVVGRFVAKWVLEFLTEEDRTFSAELYPEDGTLLLVITTTHGLVTFEADEKIRRYYDKTVETLKNPPASEGM